MQKHVPIRVCKKILTLSTNPKTWPESSSYVPRQTSIKRMHTPESTGYLSNMASCTESVCTKVAEWLIDRVQREQSTRCSCLFLMDESPVRNQAFQGTSRTLPGYRPRKTNILYLLIDLGRDFEQSKNKRTPCVTNESGLES